MPYVKGKSQIKKVKGADLNVPGEKLKFIQKSAVKMGHESPMKMGHETPVKMYHKAPTKMKSYLKMNNSPEAVAIRVAADEKDKQHSSEAGKKRLDKDISYMIGSVLSKHMK